MLTQHRCYSMEEYRKISEFTAITVQKCGAVLLQYCLAPASVLLQYCCSSDSGLPQYCLSTA
jgi:hypothetical protein